MNEELMQKWIDALRSGEYVQGFYALRSLSDSYCCLGVLTDLVGDRSKWVRSPLDNSYMYGDIGSCLPRDVAEEIGIGMTGMFYLHDPLAPDLPKGLQDHSEGISSLVGLNDGTQLTFHEIADVLEYGLAHPDVVEFLPWDHPTFGVDNDQA